MELMSAEINEIALALCKAQTEMGPALKDKTNPFFKSSYADLSSCISALREPFGNNALCFFQSTLPADGGNIRIVTTIAHKTGQWIRGVIDIKPTKNDPQGAGSAISYGKRYGLQALSGLPTEDDDGNAASRNQRQQPPRQIQSQKQTTISNVWGDGVKDKYIIMCEEMNMDKTQQAAMVGYYLRESKCDFMTIKGSESLLANFGDVYNGFISVTNG